MKEDLSFRMKEEIKELIEQKWIKMFEEDREELRAEEPRRIS